MKLDSRIKWAAFERCMLNAAKQYGAIEEVLKSQVEPTFDIPEAPNAKSPEYMIWIEDIKEIKKE